MTGVESSLTLKWPCRGRAANRRARCPPDSRGRCAVGSDGSEAGRRPRDGESRSRDHAAEPSPAADIRAEN